MPYEPKHQDISVTLAEYVKQKADSNPKAASKALITIIDELTARGWFEKFRKFPDDLPSEVRTFFYVLFVDNEINNGGFAQYFFNGYGVYAEDAVGAFKKIGAPKKAELLAYVMASFPDGKYPKTIDEYSALLVDDNIDKIAFLDDKRINDGYYDSNENIDELLVTHVKNNFTKFAP